MVSSLDKVLSDDSVPMKSLLSSVQSTAQVSLSAAAEVAELSSRQGYCLLQGEGHLA